MIVDSLRILVPTVVIPAAVFGLNWAFRFRQDYAQTAPSDCLLAIMIFDGAVVSAAKDFEPFIHNEHLREAVQNWHILLAFLGVAIYLFFVTWAEPIVARYYDRQGTGPMTFVGTLMLCWAIVFGLVSLHISYFVWK